MSAPVRSRKGLQVAGFLALWFSVPVSIILVGGLPIADDLRAFLLPLILFYLVSPPIGLVSLICAILFDKMGLRLQSLLAFLVPVSVVLGIVGEWRFALMDPLFRANDLLHFETTKAAYDRQLRELPESERHLRTFIWESNMFGGSGVAYDDSDQIALARNRRSKQWLDEAANSELSALCRVEPVEVHYYIIYFGC
ncbi:MAG: hypothetical protein WB757_04880 [Candidatus Cybelea sp.]|jgi:hypothetical protein